MERGNVTSVYKLNTLNFSPSLRHWCCLNSSCHDDSDCSGKTCRESGAPHWITNSLGVSVPDNLPVIISPPIFRANRHILDVLVSEWIESFVRLGGFRNLLLRMGRVKRRKHFMLCWPCISKYACDETNLMNYLSTPYWVTTPLYVSGLRIAHHQKVTLCICDNWYVFYAVVDCRRAKDIHTRIHCYLLMMGN
jgi:hypothetical protein